MTTRDSNKLVTKNNIRVM